MSTELAMELPVPTEEIKPQEEKAMRSFYIRTKCTECKRNAIYFPQFKRAVCPSCLNIKLYTQVDNATVDDYVPQSSWDMLKEQEAMSQYALKYIDPRSDPLYSTPGRNESCSCGSGKKYKKCCLANDMASRNLQALELNNSRRNVAIVSVANDFKLISQVFEQMGEGTELETTAVKFRPFMDRRGTLEEELKDDLSGNTCSA